MAALPRMVTAFARDLARAADRGLKAIADPARAGPMAAYMKGIQNFLGVAKPERAALFTRIAPDHLPADAAAYAAGVAALWALPYREGRYFAIAFARRHRSFITPDRLPLYERMLREGAWWDVVDEIAPHLVGVQLRDHRDVIQPVLDRWVTDGDFWIRRAALLAHLGHKADIDQDTLFAHCRLLAPEKEFFIRKAIGWVLRDLGRRRPDVVRAFLAAHGHELSGLSRREAVKWL